MQCLERFETAFRSRQRVVVWAMEVNPKPRTLRVSLNRARHTLATLCFGSLVCVGMVGARWLWVHVFHADPGGPVEGAGHLYLVWNLFLAWIPVVLAWMVWQLRERPWWRRGMSWLVMLLWILFFPNDFYIVTDYVHSRNFGSAGVPQWFDILLTTAYACGGMFLGCLSLYLMQLLVRARFGWRVGWLFAATMLAIGSVGIFMGRYWRFNSWDALLNPVQFGIGLGHLIAMNIRAILPFSVTFFFFSLTVYCFVVSMARLHEEEGEDQP
jgi:uncharacterized membrane protein